MAKPRNASKRVGGRRGVSRSSENTDVDPRDVQQAWLVVRTIVVVTFWILAASVLSTRTYYVMGYEVGRLLTPALEFVGASLPALCITGLLGSAWAALRIASQRRRQEDEALSFHSEILLAVAALPAAANFVEIGMGSELQRTFWELLWIAGWTGASFTSLGRISILNDPGIAQRYIGGVVVLAAALVACWWIAQSIYYHESFLLGFNDFGHFAQRVANTAAGRGFLLETPVLPAFWDHFNPGLLLLVPLWKVWPDERLFFVLQALSLALPSLLIFRLASNLKLSKTTAAVLAIAWLLQPVVGQMNLAYTYGWHPISLAIPSMFLAIERATAHKYLAAILALIFAMSMEEGVIAVVACFAAVCAAWTWWEAWRVRDETAAIEPSHSRLFGLNAVHWMALSASSILAFVAVFTLSGLAEFQTGRFVALGSSLREVILSPIAKPSIFWPQLFDLTDWTFLACLIIPLGVTVLWRSKWLLLAILPPVAVLFVWDHRPATCLAFQYPSSLLPVLWLAVVLGVRKIPSVLQHSAASGVLAASLLLGLYLGMFPYSGDTLGDVKVATYAPSETQNRRRGAEDSRWLLAELSKIERDATVLSTGRIASHLVGCRDLETVGQFIQRRRDLENLPSRAEGALAYYDWIILDYNEQFQQLPVETEAIYSEALESGYQVAKDEYSVVFLKSPNTARSSEQ